MTILITGTAASGGVCSGRARLAVGVLDVACVQPGEVIVVAALTSDLLPLLAVAGAGGVEAVGVLEGLTATAREHGVAMVTGAARAMRVIDEGDMVTVDGCGGVIVVGCA
jgi:pyruvate,water dikinase